jgi:hypothetical protein
MFSNKHGRIKHNFVSEIDQFLQELNNIPGSKSNARIEEEQKYQRIFALRDHPQVSLSEELTWKDF